MQLPSLADRTWYAYHCLPRDEGGELPSYRQLEHAYGLAIGTFSKITNGTKAHLWPDTVPHIAEALRCSAVWLMQGEGSAPKLPIGAQVPPRPGTGWKVHADVPGWEDAVTEAKGRPASEKVIPDAAFRAGADLPIFRHIARMTADLAIFVSGYAYWTATPAQQTRYSTLEARTTSAAQQPRARHLRRPAVK
jgi:transcriptional regulator with XRE-family HTH domain